MHEMERHRAEQPFVNPRRSKGAATMRSAPCVSRSANKQRLDRGHLASVRPVGEVFGLDAVRGKVTDQHLGQLGQRARAPRR